MKSLSFPFAVVAVPLVLAVVTGCTSLPGRAGASSAKLTAGWKQISFTNEVQHPYDLKLSDRYHYNRWTDTHDFWVYYTDKPHAPPPNRTTARTEMRLQTYHTGEHMFDADLNISPGTFACIAQVFDAAHGPVTMLIAHPDGTVTAGRTLIATNAIGRWWNLKMSNNPVAGGKIRIYANNVLVATFDNRGPRDYYFKCGVYSRHNSARSEVRYRHIKMWIRDSSAPSKMAGPREAAGDGGRITMMTSVR